MCLEMTRQPHSRRAAHGNWSEGIHATVPSLGRYHIIFLCSASTDASDGVRNVSEMTNERGNTPRYGYVASRWLQRCVAGHVVVPREAEKA